MEAQRPKALSPTPSEIPATKAVSPVVSETQAVSPVSSETLKAVAPVSQPAKASPVTEVPKAVSPVASETVPKAVSPVASHVPKAVSPVASETVPKSVSPVASQTLPKAVSPVASETVPKSVSPVASQTLPKAVSPASPVPVLKGPPGPPQVLNFRCPNFQKDCDGTYDLLPGKEANGRPVWKKRGGDRWMYLTIDKNWGVGGKSEFDKDFNCKNSYVFHPRTLGAPSPELLPKGWQLFDGQAWREDADVQATAEGSATGGQVPLQQKAPPAQPPQPTALQGLAGLSSGTPSARSHQTPAAPSSSRTQVDGAALADSILGARARATDGDNSWDEEPSQAPRGVAPPASVAPPVAPPAAPPVAPTAAQDQRASARAMADMGFDSESGSNAAEAFPRERPSDRAAMADLGFDSEQPSPVQHDARGRAESSDWDD
ncbi:unnamed protein product [Effrenium voratum]|nr:unnamed protein product [Effrenium voratum]